MFIRDGGVVFLTPGTDVSPIIYWVSEVLIYLLWYAQYWPGLRKNRLCPPPAIPKLRLSCSDKIH